jgi:hypothetical protein
LTDHKCQGSIGRAALSNFRPTVFTVDQHSLFRHGGETMSMELTLDEFAQLILLSWGNYDGPVHLHMVDGSGQGANGMQVDLMTTIAPNTTAYVQLDYFHSFPLLSHTKIERSRWVIVVVDLSPDLAHAREVVDFIVTNQHQDRVRLVVLTNLKQWSQKSPWLSCLTSCVHDALFVRDARVKGRCIPTVLGGMKSLLKKKRERMHERSEIDAQDDIELIESYEVSEHPAPRPGQ